MTQDAKAAGMPDDDDAAALRDRVRALEETVQEQQSTIEQLMPSRRAILAGGAGLVGGAALTGQASAQSAAGQVGTSTEPVDVDAATVNAQTVNTDDSVTVTTGEATNTLHYGSNQDRDNAGDESVALGIGARANGDDGSGGTIGRHVAVGYEAAQNNTGGRVTASGYEAARSNTGARVTASGFQAANTNTGGRVTASGYQAAQNNTGSGVIAIGFGAARNNSTDNLFVVTDRFGNRRMEMDLNNGDLKIDGSLTQNANL